MKVEAIKQRFSQSNGDALVFRNRIGTLVEFDSQKLKLELDMFPNLDIEVTEIVAK